MTVVPVNEAGPVFDNSDISVRINESTSVGALIASFNATDLDSADQTDDGVLVYSISSGNGENPFVIDSSTAEVYLASPLDAESTVNYSLVITATEKEGGNSATANLSITVVDMNDHCPVCRANHIIIEEDEENGESLIPIDLLLLL